MSILLSLSLLLLLFFLNTHLSFSTPVSTSATSDCPLNISAFNVTRAAILCSDPQARASCCRYINALVAVSIARYANTTSSLGVSPELSPICLETLSETLELHGMTKNASAFCGFGTKIPVNYECLGITTVNQMLQSPKFSNVTLNCKAPLGEGRCRKCLNAGILYIRNLVGSGDNTTVSTCRDATFVALASQVDDVSAVEIAHCFFGVQGLSNISGPSSMFIKFSYKETKKATNNFSTIIGQGGFGTVYKAEFSDGSTLAVKHMDKVSEQAVEEFCREIELLARLHHRHLVALKGFCIEKHQRFLMYEYMANGSLKDNLHNPGIAPMSWQTRIQIAIDVANALEYLHFYCDPPLCHRDIKSSNILLDENSVGKVADFGLAYASKDGSICFEPVNTEIRGTPGYMDPEYMVTQELTEKSDIYSYGVVLLELVTSRRAIHDNKNLVESCQSILTSESRHGELVDPAIGKSFDFDQLQTVVTIVKWCTQKEGRARPSIKQVLRLLYECADPMHDGFIEAVEDERRTSKGKIHRRDGIFQSWDGRGLASSSSTSRSYCSRSFLLETGSSPQSPSNIPSI